MATYKIKGGRLLRKYRAQNATFSYQALNDAEKVAANLCNLPWEEATVEEPTFPAHSGTSEELDAENVSMQDSFDAALFCAEHLNARHRAYANAACYRFTMPEDASGKLLTEIKAKVYCDPYNSNGARISVYVSDDENPPMECAACRLGSSEDDSDDAQSNNGTETEAASEWSSTNTHVEGVAPRKAKDGSWFANSGYAVIRPAGGLAMKKYLFVFVLMENYATARAGFLEGAAYADGVFELATAEDVEGLNVGAVNELISAGSNDMSNEQKIVEGNYPNLSNVCASVQTVQLNGNGDEFDIESLQQDGGFYRYNFTNSTINATNEHFAKMLDIDASKITAVNMIMLNKNVGVGPSKDNLSAEKNTDTEYKVTLGYAICGTFEGGTFPSLPGVYLYSCDDDAILSYDGAEDITLPDEYRDFAKIHNGIAMALVCPAKVSSIDEGAGKLTMFNSNGNFLFLIGKDGTYYDFKYSVDIGKPTLAPVLYFQLNFSGKFEFAIPFDKLPRVINDVAPYNLIDVAGVKRGGDVDVYCNLSSAVNYNTNTTKNLVAAPTGPSAIFEIYVLIISRIDNTYKLLRLSTTLSACALDYAGGESYGLVIRYGGRDSDNNVMEVVGACTNDDPSFEMETVSHSFSHYFILCGSATREGGKYPAYRTISMGNVGTDNKPIIGAVIGSTNLVVNPEAHKSFSDIFESCCSLSTSFTVEKEDFGSTSSIRIYCYSLKSGNQLLFGVFRRRGTVDDFCLTFKGQGSLIFSTFKSFNPASLCLLPTQECSVLIGASAKTHKYATNIVALNEDVVAGRGIAYGKAVSGKAASGDSIGLAPDDVRSCASFVIRTDKKNVPKPDNGGLWVANGVDVVQLTTCAALIPFALPKWDVRYVRMNWENLTFTEGAKLNVWVKEAFVDEYPDLKNFAFYDVSQRSVDGWTLVGVIDASESGTVNMPLKVRGKVATFLLTAYIGAPDDLKDGTPVGVGDVDVDIFNSKIYNAGTGWRPNITLLG